MRRLLQLLAVLGVASNSLDDLRTWIASLGGFIHPAFELTTGSDPSWTARGIFVNERIPKGTRLISLPESSKICAEVPCDLVVLLRSELDKGNTSSYWPYLRLLPQLHEMTVPALWSENSIRLLHGLAGRNWVDWERFYFTDRCKLKKDDPRSLRAALLVATRQHYESYGQYGKYCLLPGFDLINHGRGLRQNVGYEKSGPELRFTASATAVVERNYQLFSNYGLGTIDLFVQFGFVERHPTLWELTLHEKKYVWEVEERGIANLRRKSHYGYSSDQLATVLGEHFKALPEPLPPKGAPTQPNLPRNFEKRTFTLSEPACDKRNAKDKRKGSSKFYQL